MRCPRCVSEELTRSRRNRWERLVFPVVRADAFRCRNCKKRFRVGLGWGVVILAILAAAVGVSVVAAIVFVDTRNDNRPKAERVTPRAAESSAPVATIPTTVPGVNNTSAAKIDNTAVPADPVPAGKTSK
jgi:hypothetical protein